MSRELNRTPRSTEFARSTLACKEFGNWQNFITAAGLSYPDKTKDHEAQKKIIIKEIQALAQQLGRVPKATEYNRYSAVYTHYSSWLTAPCLTKESNEIYE